MTKQEIAAKIEELQNQIDELKEAADRVAENPFERKEQNFYYISSYGKVLETRDYQAKEEDQIYVVANYCTSENLMKKRAAEETLSRLIWREAEIANADKTRKDCQVLYVVGYYAKDKSIMPWLVDASLVGSVGFFHIDDARSCIKNVVIPFVKNHPELGWELEEREN